MKQKTISETIYNEERISFLGNKFLIGNGYFGIRGTMEEYKKENMPAINMAGIYDKVGDKWRESVNAPNPLFTYVKVDKKAFVLPESKPFSHEQSIDIETAIHTRKTVWKTEKGMITISCERFASMANQHLVCMKYSVFTDFNCELEIVTGIDGDVWDINGPHFAKITPELCQNTEKVTGITGEKGIKVTVEQSVKTELKATSFSDAFSAYKKMTVSAKAGKEFGFTKIASIYTSCDDFENAEDITRLNYETEKAKHIEKWANIWDISYIQIDGDEEAELALNYSIYHLNCIAPRNMKNKSIAARGLSGQVYKGAVFWDTEMFMIDYYIHTEPEIARTLIAYRIATLEGAKNKAREYGLDGAYYAWESQEGGFEGCSDYNVVDVFTKRPMRTHFRDKQYHISSAVVYGIVKYIKATGDKTILKDGAMEVIVECAKMYRSLLLKKADSKEYEIHDVVGPDEYHERVNNNAYTNKMAQLTFKTACEVIKEFDYEKYKDLYANFEDAYKNIKIVNPNENSLIEQFDGYFSLEDTTPDVLRTRLLDEKEYWGGAYGVASGTQVIKQADVIAMMSIFKDEYTKEDMQKNWKYYEPRTEHGSSLSACMYSQVACSIGKPDKAYPFFMKSAKADLLPGGKEWAGLIYIGGTHPASEGGAWIVAVNGFAGISIKDGKLICEPNLPNNWKGMHFKLGFMGDIYQIDIENGKGEVKKL
jgi:kojibiose phosphorylase/nigerose phosphorylase